MVGKGAFMRRCLVAVVALVALPVLAQDVDPDTLARARWPDTFLHRAMFKRQRAAGAAVPEPPDKRGRNALLKVGWHAVFATLTDFDKIDHVAIVRFFPSGPGVYVGYAAGAPVGASEDDDDRTCWWLETTDREIIMTTGDERTYRAPLLTGWNTVEFRCGIDSSDRLLRSLAIRVNDRDLAGRLPFNGRLDMLFVSAHSADVVLANGGFEIGETRRVDQNRPRSNR